MRADRVETNLIESVRELIKNDRFLLDKDVHERTIAQQLAEYLGDRFAGFQVDCEYNSDVDGEGGKKRVYGEGLRDGGVVYPDIIVHHRGLNGPEHNILVIEIKKPATVAHNGDRDRAKLRSYTSSQEPNHLRYCRGALLVVGVGDRAGEFEIEWFADGEAI